MNSLSPLHDTLQSQGLFSPLALMATLKPGRYHLATDPTLRPTPFPHHLHQISAIFLKALLRVPGYNRIICQLPPRHSKTTFLAYLMFSWLLTYRHDDVLTYTYSSRLAAKQAQYLHDLIKNYGAPYRLALSPTSRAKTNFTTNSGGNFFSSSMAGAAGGLGASGLLIIDDYSSGPLAASYPMERERNWAFYTGTLQQRIQDTTTVIVVASRTHSLDLTGRLLSPDYNPDRLSWRNIKYPLLSQGEGDPLGRPPGTTLCPEIYSQSLALQQKLTTPPSLFECIYQCSPEGVPDDSVEWSSDYFPDAEIWTPHLPPTDRLRVLACDPSLGRSATTGDPSAIILLSITQDLKYHTQCDVSRRPIPLLAKAIIDHYLSYKPHALVIEENGFQAALIDYISLLLNQMKLPSIPIIGVTNSGHLGSKLFRIKMDLSHPIQNHSFRFVNDPGTRELVSQLRHFHAKMPFDDCCDALSLGVRVAQQLLWNHRG